MVKGKERAVDMMKKYVLLTSSVIYITISPSTTLVVEVRLLICGVGR